jgi:hypothetical protein
LNDLRKRAPGRVENGAHISQCLLSLLFDGSDTMLGASWHDRQLAGDKRESSMNNRLRVMSGWCGSVLCKD